MKFKVLYLFACMLFAYQVVAQYKIMGKVIDSKTKMPLAFVNIVTVNQGPGTTTDIDGVFSFESSKPIVTIKLSYVGYELKEEDVSHQSSVSIELVKTSYEIAEFKVFPGINPAERIIKEVIRNRKAHNPEKSLNFKYDSYSKMYFTLNIDSVKNDLEKLTEKDSNYIELMDWLEHHHIFMMESVSERKYKLPDKNYEKIIASRVSGLSNSTFFFVRDANAIFFFLQPYVKYFEQILPQPHFPQ